MIMVGISRDWLLLTLQVSNFDTDLVTLTQEHDLRPSWPLKIHFQLFINDLQTDYKHTKSLEHMQRKIRLSKAEVYQKILTPFFPQSRFPLNRIQPANKKQPS